MNPLSSQKPFVVQESRPAGRRECAKRSLPGAMVFFLVLVVLWVYTDYAVLYPAFVPAVTASLFVLGAIRVWTAILFIRRAEASLTLRWFFYLSILATFAVWGSFSGFTAFHFLNNPKGLLVLLSSAAFAAAATTSLAADRRLALLCVVLISAPTALGGLLRDEPEAHAFAFLSAVYGLFLIAQLQLNWRSFWTAYQVTEMEIARLEAVQFAAAKSLLLATMSHEVRTPMNGVIGMLELVLGAEISEEARGYANHARASALNLLAVLNSILAFSRNEKAGVQLALTEFEIGQWLRQISYPFACEADKKGIQLQSSLGFPEPAWYRGDPVRLSEVLTNLLSNAVKFTQTGGVTLRVERETGTADVHTLRFSVEDTGPGISATVRKQLFQPFGHSAVASGKQGAGLGLAISRQIVDAMQGEIELESEPGKGSRFLVIIPIATASQPSPSSAVPLLTACGSKFSVLVVEDDAVSGLVARRLLEKFGVQVELAVTGKEALECAATAYDLFLLDLNLPDADGLELAAKIRGIETNRNAIIVVVSAADTRELVERGARRHADAVLAKPYTAAQLAEVINLLVPR